MTFNSIDEMRKYVLSIMNDCAYLTSERMLEIMKQQIEDAYNSYSPSMYVRTGDLLNTPQRISANSRGIKTAFVDNGGWYSLVGQTKGHHFFALEGLEAGTSWGRDATDIYQNSVDICHIEIGDFYVDCMKKFGVPIK